MGPLFVANFFILTLLALSGKQNVLHWHSLLAFLGLSGFIRFFGMISGTPLGNGLWFLTLLWIYYLVFPIFERLCRDHHIGRNLVLITGIGALVLSKLTSPGVALWETAWFFLWGTYAGKHPPKPNRALYFFVTVACAVAIPIAHAMQADPVIITALIAGIGIGVVLLLTTFPLPVQWSAPFAPLSVMMLEIYVVHTYLFVRLSREPIIDLMVSFVLILGMAAVLHPAGQALGGWLARWTDVGSGPFALGRHGLGDGGEMSADGGDVRTYRRSACRDQPENNGVGESANGAE